MKTNEIQADIDERNARHDAAGEVWRAARSADLDELRKAAELALGRILRMAARPPQPGDVDEYYRCRGIILAADEAGAIDKATKPRR